MNLSLRHNILASYASQTYGTAIAIIMVPLYLRYMGAEAYGLVGFFIMLQVWFQLLDMGLTPTMARETARYSGGATDALSLRRLLRALEGIFFAVGACGAIAIMAAAGAISSGWLNAKELPLGEVKNAVMLMAMIVALRWTSGLYRGAISGFERLVWLSGFNIAIATVRFVLVIPFFIYVGVSPTEFFSFQLAVAAFELLLLVAKTYRLMPAVKSEERVAWHWEPLRRVLKFSLSLAFTSSAWVLVTQTDKLVLSKLLPLTDYAYFTLAVLVASGVIVISGPISVALVPRLTRLSAAGDVDGLIRLYRGATQAMGIVAIPAALMLAFFSEQVLWAWTGDSTIARTASPVLTLYALGNGILAISAFPYYLQMAKGDLRLHLIGNLLFVVLLIPALIWATWTYGMVGAGYAWVAANGLYFLFWVPKVHKRFLKGLHGQWLARDVGAIVLLAFGTTWLARGLITWPQDRLLVAFGIAILSSAVLAVAAAGSSAVRDAIGGRWRARVVG